MDCTDKKLRIIYGDASLGVGGSDFHYIFSYVTGGLESLVMEGLEWLYRTPKPTFWRATTDNDRGSQFHLRSGIWLSADMFIRCLDVKLRVDDHEVTTFRAPANNCHSDHEYAQNVEITFIYETITVPCTTVEIAYSVEASGKITVRAMYKGQKGLPELPVFGIRFMMPTKALGYQYCGLSGETYPDRKAGAEKGIFAVEGLPVTPYLVPQECGMHMDTEWVTVYRDTALDNSNPMPGKKGLKISCTDSKFAFSCLPYTAEELENATHQEELPAARRTVLCIAGAVRGVGGINSWGANVEKAYRISGEDDINMSFIIEKAE